MHVSRCRSLVLLSLLLASPTFGGTPAQSVGEALGDLQQKLVDFKVSATDAKTLKNESLVQAFENARSASSRGNLVAARDLLLAYRRGLDDSRAVVLDDALKIVNKAIDEQEAAANRSLDTITEKLREKIAAHAPAADFDALLKELNQHFAPSIRNFQNVTSAQRVQSTRDFIAGWQDYTVHLAAKNFDKASSSLTQLASIAARIDIVPRSEILDLQQAILQARRKTVDTLTGELTSLVERLPSLVTANAKSKDIDSFLQSLADLRQQLEQDYSNTTNEDRRRIDSLRRFAARWQDYLAEVAANKPSAQHTAQQLLSDQSFDAFFPRSKLHALIDSVAKTVDSAAAPQNPSIPPPAELTLANLDTFAAQLALAAGTGRDSALTTFNVALTSLQRSAHQIASGDVSAAQQFLRTRVSENVPPEYRPALASLRAELATAAAIVVAAPPADLTRKENENIFSYLTRVLGVATERRDWSLTQRTVDSLSLLGASAEASTFRLFFAAQNFETAGQFAAAVQHYLACLRTGNRNLPLAEIGARLKALQEEHPADYAQGEKMPFPTPAPIDSRTGEIIPILRASPSSTPRTR